MSFYSLFLFTLAEVASKPAPVWLTEEWIAGLIKFGFAIVIVVIAGVWSVKKFFIDNKIEEDKEKEKEKSGQSIIINQNPQQTQYAPPPYIPQQPYYPPAPYPSAPSRPYQEEELRNIIQHTYDGIIKSQKEHSDRIEKEYESKIQTLEEEVKRLRDIEKERDSYKEKCEEFSYEIKRITDRYALSKEVMNNTKNSMTMFLENTGPIKLVSKK